MSIGTPRGTLEQQIRTLLLSTAAAPKLDPFTADVIASAVSDAIERNNEDIAREVEGIRRQIEDVERRIAVKMPHV